MEEENVDNNQIDDDMPPLEEFNQEELSNAVTFNTFTLDNSEITEEMLENEEELKRIMNSYISKFMKDLENLPEYPRFSYIVAEEPVTIIYTEDKELYLPTIIVLDYYSKLDLRYIINSTNNDLFTEKYAVDISRYVRKNIIPDYIEEYLEEVDGMEKTPMCKENVEKLESVPYDPKKHVSEKCQICLEYFSESSDVLELECKHTFCYNCIKNYFQTYNNVCPLCRTEVGKKQEKVVDEAKIDMRHVAFTFVSRYCERCNECKRHQERNQIINLFVENDGNMELDECIKLIKD